MPRRRWLVPNHSVVRPCTLSIPIPRLPIQSHCFQTAPLTYVYTYGCVSSLRQGGIIRPEWNGLRRALDRPLPLTKLTEATHWERVACGARWLLMLTVTQGKWEGCVHSTA